MNFSSKYQPPIVRKEKGIPSPTIRLQSRGSKPWDAARIEAIIIGGIADSRMLISISVPFWPKIKR